MQHLQPNTTLQGGKYRIERVLGQGGFGITYLATQISLNRKVAIKEFFMKDFCSRNETTCTISAPSTGSSKLVEQYRKKFIKEARNLARLSHPNIINVIDVFEENDTVYYVMPYFAGGSLQDYVKMHGVLSEQEAMNYVKQIASALKYMHEEQHICHYDVKPANILLDDKGNAVLIDFGISKNYDVQGQETTATPVGVSDGYAPTEQYQQNVEEFSPASDVYALGATLYFLLHGKRPVSAVNRASGEALLMNKHFSQRIKDIINASMKISKRERAKSVDVFLGKRNDEDEVTIVDRKVIKDKTVTSTSQTYDESAGRKENKSFIKLIAAIVVIAGIIGVVLFSLNRYSSQTSKKVIDTAAIDTIDKKQIFIRGKLNNNIAFIMNLTINGNVVEGTEHYDNQSKDAIVLIKGTLEDNGTLTLYEYDKNSKTGTYEGLLSSESYSGTFTNSKGKGFQFSSVVMDEEMFKEWTNTQFETSVFSYKKSADGITVELKVDYPIRGNEELMGKTRLFIADAIGAMFDIDTKVGDLPDGQALVNHSGEIKYEDLKKEKYGENGGTNEYEETIIIKKNYENDKCVSFCASSFYCHGGVGNNFRAGATFRKEDGKQIVVLKNVINTDLNSLIIQTMKTKIGKDYEMVNVEEFERSPLPNHLPHLTKSGVQFDYQHYEIGPGVLGQISIVIPYEKMERYMSDEAKQLVN